MVVLLYPSLFWITVSVDLPVNFDALYMNPPAGLLQENCRATLRLIRGGRGSGLKEPLPNTLHDQGEEEHNTSWLHRAGRFFRRLILITSFLSPAP
jgi:hypothetical protein